MKRTKVNVQWVASMLCRAKERIVIVAAVRPAPDPVTESPIAPENPHCFSAVDAQCHGT